MLKLQYFGHLMRRASSLGKTLMLGMIESKRRKGRQRMVGWHLWLNGYESEQTPEDSEGQGSLVSCSSWGHNESDMTETKQQAQFVKMYYFMWRLPISNLNDSLLSKLIYQKISEQSKNRRPGRSRDRIIFPSLGQTHAYGNIVHVKFPVTSVREWR